MPFAWTVAKFLIKVVAPSAPELLATINTLKKQRASAAGQLGGDKLVERRLSDLEQAMGTQLQLIEQLTKQLQVFERTLTIALRLAIAGFVLAVVVLALVILR